VATADGAQSFCPACPQTAREEIQGTADRKTMKALMKQEKKELTQAKKIVVEECNIRSRVAHVLPHSL